MKRILLGLILFVLGFSAAAQKRTLITDKAIVNDSIQIAGRWVRVVSPDSTFAAANHNSLPTTKAVYDFVTASAIDTIYVLLGGGSDPDTICIADDLCAVLPPGLSASEVAGQIEDSLDVVRDTMQSLRAAILAIQDSLDNVPDGSGTAGQYALWQDGNSLVGSALSEGIDRLTVAASRTFRITGMATVGFGAGAAGDVGYDQTVSWFNGHNGTSRWAFARAATSNGIFTPGAGLFAGADGSIQQDAANLFYNDTDNTFNIGTTTYSGIYSRVNILGTGVGISTRTLALYKSNGVNYFSAYDNGRIGFGAYGGTSETTFTQASAELQVEFASSAGGLRIYNNSSRYFQGNNWYFGATNNGFGTTSPDRYLHAEISSSSTNTVLASFRTSAISTGTVTTGFGVRVIEGEAENASNTNRIITEVDAVYTTATNAAETSDLVTKVMNAGTLTERLRVDGDDGVIVTGELRVTDLDISGITKIGVANNDGDVGAKAPGFGLALAADGTPFIDSTDVATQTDLAEGLAGNNGIISALPLADVVINTYNDLIIEADGNNFTQINRESLEIATEDNNCYISHSQINIYDLPNDRRVIIAAGGITYTSSGLSDLGIISDAGIDVQTADDVNLNVNSGDSDLNIDAAIVALTGDLTAENISAGAGLDVIGATTLRGAAGAAGSASFYEPVVNGINTHTLVAGPMAADMTTTLPTSAPSTENGVWERDAGGTTILRATAHGSIAGSTDGSGDITVAHDNDDGTFNVVVQVTGTTFFHAQVHSKTGSDFKIRFYDAAGAVVTTTSVSADYTLTDI